MIPFASQRGSGQDLATHLLNAYDNELAEVADLRGAIAHDLHGAFKEWQVQAETLTRCEKYLYSLSINPDPAQGPLTRDQYMDYIHRAEQMLGLGDQPRAIVFHIKEGREHCHVVWSRIDADHEKAVHLAFDRDKLMRVTRDFAHDHGLRLPPGYEKSRNAGQLSLNERAQLQRTGLSLDDHKRHVTEAWQRSDDARSFVQALSERGYMLATGNRPYVVVDLYGHVNALPRLIDDKAVRTQDIRAFLEQDYPCEELPSVEEAQKLVADHRKVVENSIRKEDYADELAELKHAQQERRHVLEQQREILKFRQRSLRLAQEAKHRAERNKMREDHLSSTRRVRQERLENQPSGLADFLGRVSGVNFLRHKLQHYQDAKRLRAYLDQYNQLKERQAKEAIILSFRLKHQGINIDRQCASLEKVDNRELAAFMRDQQCTQYIRARGKDGAMPALDLPAKRRRTVAREAIPDLMATFERAAAPSSNDKTQHRDGEGPGKARTMNWLRHRRDREPDRER